MWNWWDMRCDYVHMNWNWWNMRCSMFKWTSIGEMCDVKCLNELELVRHKTIFTLTGICGIYNVYRLKQELMGQVNIRAYTLNKSWKLIPFSLPPLIGHHPIGSFKFSCFKCQITQMKITRVWPPIPVIKEAVSVNLSVHASTKSIS